MWSPRIRKTGTRQGLQELGKRQTEKITAQRYGRKQILEACYLVLLGPSGVGSPTKVLMPTVTGTKRKSWAQKQRKASFLQPRTERCALGLQSTRSGAGGPRSCFCAISLLRRRGGRVLARAPPGSRGLEAAVPRSLCAHGGRRHLELSVVSRLSAHAPQPRADTTTSRWDLPSAKGGVRGPCTRQPLSQ